MTDRQLLDMIEGICETALKGESVDGTVSSKVLEQIMRLTAQRSQFDAEVKR
jgi:nitrogen regulatory protein PII